MAALAVRTPETRGFVWLRAPPCDRACPAMIVDGF
jgi:hypothetical protein